MARQLWREWRSLILFLAVMFVFRSAVADWNQVPSGSMRPNILEGDRIVVDKLAYGLRVPFTLITLTRWAEPARGDIVTFESPADDRLLVKRVIGLPGDEVELRDNHLFINGTAAAYAPLQSEELQHLPIQPDLGQLAVRESIGDQAQVLLLHTAMHSSRQFYGPVVVPQGSYLMLGDNRDNSADSRVISFVSRERILGRAERVAFSLDYDNYYLPRDDRFFVDIK